MIHWPFPTPVAAMPEELEDTAAAGGGLGFGGRHDIATNTH